MRILQLIQKKQYRGAEIFCCQLSNHLLAQGNEVLIYSIYEGDAILPYIKEVKSLGSPINKRYFDLKGWRKLADIIFQFKPDIIQANAADTLKYAIFSKIIFHWKAKVVFRNASASSYYIKNKFSKFINSFLLKKVDFIISVSEASKKDLNELFPFTITKSEVIPIGIEETDIGISKNIYLKNQVNLVHIGSFTREKNHIELLQIYEKVKAKIPNSILHLIGDGALQPTIVKETKSRNLEKYVRFHGNIQNPLEFIEKADLLLLPSLIEGLPAVILEAMYCKTPVVAYNVGGVSEILNIESGNLIVKGDIDAFVDQILKVLGNPRNDEIQKSYNTVVQNYLNAEIAKKFLRSYCRIINR